MKEFKILEFKKEKTYQNVEQVLAQYAAEGWEVVSLSSDLSSDIRGKLLILLQREINDEGILA